MSEPTEVEQLRKKLDEAQAMILNARADLSEVRALLAASEEELHFTRPPVRAFARAMEVELRENDNKGGRVAWRRCGPSALLVRVREEVNEVAAELRRPKLVAANLLSEAADVANMAMMVADAAGALEVDEAQRPKSVPPTFSAYQRASARTINDTRNREEMLSNGAMGLAGEMGEVVELVKKHIFHGKELPADRFAAEIGDVLWYLAELCTATGIDLGDCAEGNVAKLLARWPDGFKPAAGAR